MKIWRKGILILGAAAILVITSLSVSAIPDGTNDVGHQKWADTGYRWESYTATRDNIDATDISYEINGNQATVTMTTVGDMSTEKGADVVYTMHLKSKDLSYYMITYVGGMGSVMGFGDYGGFMEVLDAPITGNTFTATFELSNPNSDWQVYGFNVEYYEPGNEQGEAWWDYAPNSNAPWYTGGDGDGDGGNGGSSGSSGTPGFEVITVIAALGIALIMLRRRK